MTTNRIYLGVSHAGCVREIFRSSDPDSTQPYYDYVIGPFRTRRAAEVMMVYGRNNPHLQTVEDAEVMSETFCGPFGVWVHDQGVNFTRHGTITDKGMFEGCPFSAYIFWQRAMDQVWDEELYGGSTPYAVYHVDHNDRRNFYLPSYTRHVVIYKLEDGSVEMLCQDDKEYAAFSANVEAAYEEVEAEDA